jgi:hypothetical protein
MALGILGGYPFHFDGKDDVNVILPYDLSHGVKSLTGISAQFFENVFVTVT